MKRILVLGGTGEAYAVATALSKEPNVAVTTSFAGRTREPRLPPGDVRIGGFGGAAGLARYLREHGIDLTIDATHPFAARISANAVEACAAADVTRIVLVRPAWSARPGDRWSCVADASAAAAAVRNGGERVFLATGRSELAPFAAIARCWFLIRSVEEPAEPLPPRRQIVRARGPFAYAAERALLEEHRIETIVVKNGGGDAVSAKLDAARDLGVRVVMIERPAAPPGAQANDVVAALARVRGILATDAPGLDPVSAPRSARSAG